jgi:hypothetical protein
MRCRSSVWAFGATVLVLTAPICGVVGSVALAENTAALTGIGRGAAAEHARASMTVTSGQSCNGTPVPVRPELPSLTPEQLASLQTVQRWLDLVASAMVEQPDPALFAEIKAVYPGWDVQSADDLAEGYGNMEAAHLVWVREDDDGTFVIGELVYDNASTKPCRTGFLCGRADVNGGVIDSVDLETTDGTIDDSAFTSSYPYVDGSWIPPEEETSFGGATVQERLIELCDAAVTTASDAPPGLQGRAEARGGGADANSSCQQPNGRLPADLHEGATVTIRDASSGEVIGTGTVKEPEFVTLDDADGDGAPEWRCTFPITGTLSSTPDSITVQVGELPPWGPVSLDDSGGFTVPVPLD